MAKKTLLKNGYFFNEGGCFYGDLLIQGETIMHLGTDLGSNADAVFNLDGKHVFPGGLDAHVHMDVVCDDNSLSAGYDTDSVAAAIGGTTTVLDYVMQEKNTSLYDTITQWNAKASVQSAVDYGFHVIVTDASNKTLQEISNLKEYGITSFKLFMANDIALNDADMIRIMATIRSNGGIACIHAENKAIIDFLQQQDALHGSLTPYQHAKSRPIYSETEAVNRVIAFSEMTGCPVLIAHISSGGALAHVKAAKERGLSIYGETCPHYLLMNEDKYLLQGFESAKYVISPPLRSADNSEQLWAGLKNNNIDIISSDHNGFSFARQKKLGINDYRKIPNGSPGIEHRFSLLLDGCIRKNVPLSKFSSLISTNPAKLFGLYPRKGAILPGSDADLVVVDLIGKTTISAASQTQKSDYSPYEGFECTGSIKAVFLRGTLIVENSCFVGNHGQGTYLKRSK